jgi:dipeptidyl aminopeptidase/acylaminoacyl peptidase
MVHLSKLLGTVIIALFCSLPRAGFAATGYEKPPQPVVDALTAPPTPIASVSPTRDYVLLLRPVRYPSINEVAQPMARLAGMRIDIRTNSLHLAPSFPQYVLKRLADNTDVIINPAGAKFSYPAWSPDGQHFAFTNTTANCLELWIGTTATGAVHKIEGVRVNGVRADRSLPLDWLSDNRTLLMSLIPEGRGDVPKEADIPEGPHTQESAGHAGPVRTYEDMLSTPYDEEAFDYYATAQLTLIDMGNGGLKALGKPGIFTSIAPSPDGRHFLIARVQRPYSYLHPAEAFPTEVEVWNAAGAKEYTVANLPLADRVPIEGVRTGPRGYRWLPNGPATLFWAEAMDGGNPKEKVLHRDRLLMLDSPFQEQPHEVFQTVERFRGLQSMDGSNVALVTDYERNKRWQRTIAVDLTKPNDPGTVLFARNVQDRYGDPGSPVNGTLPNGATAILRSGDNILLASAGASPTGDHPFIDRYNVSTKKTERVFQSKPGTYEIVEAVLNDDGTKLLTRRESPSDPPNFFIREGDSLKALTHYTDPLPQVRQIRKELVTYKREDGVNLSFMLYLPPGYKPGTKLPTLLWAYPLEYNDAGTAGQVSGSNDRFTTLTGHLLFTLCGYAVLDNAAMPVIGDPETVNNTYVQQIVADAKAAIDKAVEMGVTDRDRVGVGGHSYGAFMTANLLAHSNLFRAGLAESGAYNRTLTPFGFQTERRTFWEAQDVYMTMSPFVHAKDIKTPLLLIHGEADDNTGTFPIQSERLYQAVMGNGGIVRLVMLPSEAHGYRALETNEDVLAEELHWLDKHTASRQQ